MSANRCIIREIKYPQSVRNFNTIVNVIDYVDEHKAVK